ncbi:MAG: M28 family peptidase [Planctomycetia bacterium]|nr:M28 family peptidase [Planctomycetia bacterium]
MPGRPHVGPLPELTDAERALATALEADVTALSVEIGERHAGRFHYDNLRKAEALLAERLKAAGYEVERESFEARGRTVANLVVERRGTTRAEEIVIVGAHYDSAEETPGANDNGTGVAATLALARAFADRQPTRTLRFVVGWSDHWAFWQEGYPGVMVTDTAVFRYPYYHDPEDTPDKLDFTRIARVVAGLEHVVTHLVDDP